MTPIEKAKGPHLYKSGRDTIAHATGPESQHMPTTRNATVGSAPVMQSDGSVAWTPVATSVAQLPQSVESFPRGDTVWQVDPGGLWDSGKCFVQMFSTLGRTQLTHVDFQFGAVGSGSDGAWAIWGGVDATGAWTLLAQGSLPNTSKGTVRVPFVTPLNLASYDSVALAQDPGAAGIMQPVRQASTYFSPNPPSGPPAAYAYLGTHTHGAAFTTLPVIPANDAIYLMQRWSSIGVR